MAANWLNKKELGTVFEEGYVTPMNSNPEVLQQLLARAEYLRVQTAMFGPSPGWQQDGSFIPPIIAGSMSEEGGQIGNHFMKINTEMLKHIWLVGHFSHHHFSDHTDNNLNNNHNSKHANNMRRQIHTPHTSSSRGIRGQKKQLTK